MIHVSPALLTILTLSLWNSYQYKNLFFSERLTMKGVIGIGNTLKGDDGIGMILAQKMEEREIPPDVKVFDAGTGGMKILHRLKDLEKAIIIDAVRFGGDPGDHVFFSPDEVKSLRESRGTHGTDLLEVLELSERVGEAPEDVLILGIQPKDDSTRSGISPELEKKIPEIMEELDKKVKSV